MAAFYAKVSSNPTLGPVFADKVSDWSSHEAKIAAFWRNEILLARSYCGNPMRKHMQASTVKDGHFPIWLALFDSVLAAQPPVDVMAGWSGWTHRIGAGSRFGLTLENSDGVPNLRYDVP